jgi:hypothetical protein
MMSEPVALTARQPPELRLLHVRLDTLEEDIRKVRDTVNRTMTPTLEVQGIATLLLTGAGPLKRVESIAKHIRGHVESNESSSDSVSDICDCTDSESLKGLIDEIIKMMDIVTDSHKNASSGVNEIVKGFVSLGGAQQYELGNHITRSCRQVTTAIAALRSKLKIPGGYRDRWKEFDAMVELLVRPLFTEYVDFVSGLAIRDNALDDRICSMTDQLLEELYEGHLGGSLVVPANRAALGQVLQSVIKLGFPEWTIWGIPLVGHEVGLKVPLTDVRLAELLEEDEGYKMRPGLRANLLADIFATYTLGLCYAHAVIRLRLQPFQESPPDPDQPHDADRARVILAALDRLKGPGYGRRPAGSEPGSGPTSPGPDGDLGDDARYRGAVDMLRTLWESEADEPADADAQSPKGLEKFLDHALDTLVARGFRAFSPHRWTSSMALLELCDKDVKPEAMGPQAILDLLTAAWQLRAIMPETGAERTEKIKRTERWVKECADQALLARSALRRPHRGLYDGAWPQQPVAKRGDPKP